MKDQSSNIKKRKAYLCNKKRHCRISNFCNIHCKHTYDEYYAIHKKDIRNYEEIRTEDGILVIEKED